MKNLSGRLWLGCVILLLGCCVLNLMAGSISLWPEHGDFSLNGFQRTALLDIRLPRLCMAALGGALLGASGLMLQTLMRNPLAAPDVVGVTAGAAVMAAATLIVAPQISNESLAVLASVGALLGFLLAYVLARQGGDVSPTRLALTGVAVGATLLAVEHFLLLMAPADITPSLSFIAGTVYGVDWHRVKALWPVAVCLLGVALFFSSSLDVLALEEDTVKSLGFPLKSRRAFLLLLAATLTGWGVAGAGILGFVGLIAPQIAKRKVGVSHFQRLLMTMMWGAILVVVADFLGRIIAPPLEIPVGIVTTLIGTPYFLWLLIRGVRHG